MNINILRKASLSALYMPNHEVKPRGSGLYSQSTKSWKGPIVKSYFSSHYLLKLHINHLQNSVLCIFTHSFLLPMSPQNLCFCFHSFGFWFLHFQCVPLHRLLTTCTGLPNITVLWHCWATLYSNPLLSENSGSGVFSSTLSLSPPVGLSFSPPSALGYTFFSKLSAGKGIRDEARRLATRSSPSCHSSVVWGIPRHSFRAPSSGTHRQSLRPPRPGPAVSPVQTDTRAGLGHLGLCVHPVLPGAAATSATSAAWTEFVGPERRNLNMAARAKSRPRPLRNPPTLGPALQRSCRLSGPNS